MSDQIPQDLVNEILCRLPVKTLLRFKCVSKPWCFQINSQDFIKQHLNHSFKTYNNVSVILTIPMQKTVHSLNFDALDTAIKLDHNPLMTCHEEPLTFVGSCNGLLCYAHPNQGIALWNPLTRKHKILPKCWMNMFGALDYSGALFFGFGYHTINDDYKVVRISQVICLEGEDIKCEVMVYSLKTNEWTRVQKETHFAYAVGYCERSRLGTFVDGSLHWRIDPNLHKERSNDDIIVAFDLGVEEFSVVEQPEYGVTLCYKNLGVFRECLCVAAYCEDKSVDLWVMKEYNVKDSWTKLLSVAPPNEKSIIRPLAYSKKGDQVLFEKESGNLFWYDLGMKRRKRVKIQNMPNSFVADIFHGSLVSLDVNGGTDEKKKEVVEGKMSGKKRDGFLSKGFKLFL